MKISHTAPLIIGFVSDLMFTSKIGNVVNYLGYEIKWIETTADIGGDQPAALDTKPGEKLTGEEGRLFEKITQWQPALLLFDLNNAAIPWQRWIPILKSSPATRRIPVMAFGSHINVEQIQAARRLGADQVFARSRFSADMPALIQKHAFVPDYDAISKACQQPLPALVKQGINLFNQGAYYRCHDDLEAAWRADETPGRDLYRGILQVGIAYYQIERGNYRGAVKMLLRVRQWLDPLPDICQDVDVAQLREDVTAVYAALAQIGSEDIEDFDRALFRPIRLIDRNDTN